MDPDSYVNSNTDILKGRKSDVNNADQSDLSDEDCCLLYQKMLYQLPENMEEIVEASDESDSDSEGFSPLAKIVSKPGIINDQ